MNPFLGMTLFMLTCAILPVTALYLFGKLLLWRSGLKKYSVKNTLTLPSVNVALVCNNIIFTISGIREDADSIQMHVKSLIPPINQYFVIPRTNIVEVNRTDSSIRIMIA